MKPHSAILADAEVSRRPSVQLDCTRFRRTDPLTKWKNRLIVGCGLATILLGLWWWFSGWWRGGTSPVFAPGPVAFVHAPWESQCSVCHAPESWDRSRWGAQVFGFNHTPDSRCNACHSRENPPGSGQFEPYAPHHAAASAADTPSCAACHLEHQGRDADLNRVADRYCTDCHSRLTGRAQVADWATHPPSQSLAEDQGRLRFNHEQHLRAGLGRIDGSTLKRWGDIQDPAERERLGGKAEADRAPVQLACAACHETEADRAVGGVPPGRGSGSLMLPISYDRHCKVCHPIAVSQPGDGRGPIDIPHGLEPGRLQPLLEGIIVSRRLDDMKRAGAFEPPWLLPGPRKEQFKKSVADEVAAVERNLLTDRYCGLCHQFSDSAGTLEFRKQKVLPTQVPDLWFPHARFSHAAHRMVDCLSCHAEMSRSKSSATIGVPNIDNCKQCHGTAASGGANVRATCVTCHSYHNGDRPREGFGARARTPHPAKPDVGTFLRPGS